MQCQRVGKATTQSSPQRFSPEPLAILLCPLLRHSGPLLPCKVRSLVELVRCSAAPSTLCRAPPAASQEACERKGSCAVQVIWVTEAGQTQGKQLLRATGPRVAPPVGVGQDQGAQELEVRKSAHRGLGRALLTRALGTACAVVGLAEWLS